MRTIRNLATVVAIVAAGRSAEAQQLDSTSQTINMSVASINKLAMPSLVSLSITSGAAGDTLLTVSNGSTYDIITNDPLAKITAALDQAMPVGSHLSVDLTAPTGATHVAKHELTTDAFDVVTGIAPVSQKGIALTYTFDATVNTPASFNRTVSYVLVHGA